MPENKALSLLMMSILPKNSITHILMNRRKNTKLKCARILKRTASADMVANADLLMDILNYLVKMRPKIIFIERKNVFHFGTMEYVHMEPDASLDIMNSQNKQRTFYKYAIGSKIFHSI
jgi:hypothetical protein